jgi:hypothetical protein
LKRLWREEVIRGRCIVYIDESGFEREAKRERGYSQKGARCYDVQDWSKIPGRTNVIGALIDNTILSCSLWETTITTDVFYAWLTQDLIPRLPENSILVLDNAAFHKRYDIKEAIETAGHILLYLPPYSPDLNPIEHSWANLKELRKTLRCSVEELFSSLRYYGKL